MEFNNFGDIPDSHHNFNSPCAAFIQVLAITCPCNKKMQIYRSCDIDSHTIS